MRLAHVLLRRCAALFIWAMVVVSSTLGIAADSAGGRALVAKYPALRAKLERNQFGAPIYLESSETHGALRVDMYGIFNYPFAALKDALHSPGNWCDITPLHINIKGCAAKDAADQSLLTLYSGRKYYQPLSDAYQIKFKFRLPAEAADYLNVALTADEGPLSTKDHRISLEAVPLDEAHTFVHFSYSYSNGALARATIKGYFSSVGRDKIGFTVVTDRSGKKAYIDGVRGAIERNAVRYYFAVQSYLDTLKYPEAQRFEYRIGRWYDLTARYPRQLKEMEKPEYLSMKRREHLNQLRLIGIQAPASPHSAERHPLP